MIEKNIFQTFVDNQLPDEVLDLINLMRSNNPEYTYCFYTDSDILEFIDNCFDGEIFDAYCRLQIGAAKADFWRYLVLYVYGGVYIDIDSHIHIPLKDFLLEEDAAIVTRESNPGHFVQWCLMIRSRHPILEKTIEKVLRNIAENSESRLNYVTGPPVLSSAIEGLYADFELPSLYYGDDTDINSRMNASEPRYARFVGTDFNNNGFIFKHPYYYTLYNDKKLPWMEDQKNRRVVL